MLLKKIGFLFPLSELAVIIMCISLSQVNSSARDARDVFGISGSITEVRVSPAGTCRVVAGLGYRDSAIPGATLRVVRNGREIGSVTLDESGADTSTGIFHAACEGCRPKVKDNVVITESVPKPMLPEIILPPGDREKKKPELQPPDDNYRALREIFKAFLAGSPPQPPGYPPSANGNTADTECPGNISAFGDPDADVESDMFLKPGDYIVISSDVDQEKECAIVDKNGYVESKYTGRIQVAGRTIAQIERKIFLEKPAAVAGFDISIIPRRSMRIDNPGGTTITVHLMGVFSPTGDCLLKNSARMEEVTDECGVPLPGFTGRALLVRFAPGGGSLLRSRELSIPVASPAPAVPMQVAAQDTPATDVSPELRDGDIIFFPASGQHRRDFINEVLPYLTAPAAR